MKKTLLLLAAILTLTSGSCKKSVSGEPESPSGGNTVPTEETGLALSLSPYFDAQMESAVPEALTGSDRCDIFFLSREEPLWQGSITQGGRLPDAFDGTCIVGYPQGRISVTEDGALHYEVPTVQNGRPEPFWSGSFQVTASSGTPKVAMSVPYSLLYITLGKGDYTVSSLILTASKGEKIAGTVTVDPDGGQIEAQEEEIRIVFPEPVDCSGEDRLVPVVVAPVRIEGGYTIEAIDAEGIHTQEYYGWNMSFPAGGMIQGGDVASRYHTQVVFNAGGGLYVVDADRAGGTRYQDGLMWKWNAAAHKGALGTAVTDNMDEGKPFDNGTKYAVCSSYNWAAVISAVTGDVLFYTNQCTMAHSVEVLPRNRLAVACSTGGDCLQIYDIDRSDEVLCSTPLTFGHGVVWDEERQRLYASGYDFIQIYRLKDWETDHPSLELEETLPTPTTHVHDLVLTDRNTLSVAGIQAYFLDIDSRTFSVIPAFSSTTNLKSVNCNPLTGEVWYTKGEEYWWTHRMRHYTDYRSWSGGESTGIDVALNCYKVRVKHW